MMILRTFISLLYYIIITYNYDDIMDILTRTRQHIIIILHCYNIRILIILWTFVQVL